MDLIYLIVFLISFFIEEIDNMIMTKVNLQSLKREEILFVSDEPSLLQCAQRCKFRDKDAMVDFRNSRCRCIKYDDEDEVRNQETLTGIFVNKKIQKIEKAQPAIVTTPKPTKIMNVALNKIANQSSTRSPANNAIDGSTSSSSYTLNEDKPWWSVDLKNIEGIRYMILKAYIGGDDNKALIVETRQKKEDAWIMCKNIGDYDTNPLNFTCRTEMPLARYIKIRSTIKCELDLFEFEVYANVPLY